MTFLEATRLLALGACTTLLSGCMALALAPSAIVAGGMINGSREVIIQVTVDENSFASDARMALANAKSLSVVASDRTSVMAADLFETRGGYKVTLDRPTAKAGDMTGSERRDALRRLCANPRPDVAMLGRVIKTETGHTMMGVLTGRAKVSNNWTMEILDCRTKVPYAFGGTMEFDGGIYNQKAPSEIEELMGAEIGGKILDAIGKRTTAQVDVHPAPQGASHPVNTSASQPAPLTEIQASRPPAPRVVASIKPLSTVEVQQRLLELGYQPGAADGVLGKRTVDALRRFQQDNNIQITGKIDPDTLSRLPEAGRSR